MTGRHPAERQDNVVLGAALTEAGRGGIARVARLALQALRRHGAATTALSYLDVGGSDCDGVRIRSAHGNKLRFVAMCHRAARGADLLVFDSAGIARGRPRIPGLRRPYAVFMCGIEAWEGLRPSARASYRDADLVLAVSRYTLSRFEALHGALPNARVCWPGTEQEEEEPAHRPAAGSRPPTALILGRTDRSPQNKGHYELIAVWPRIVERVPEARLIIAGGGDDLESVRAAAACSAAARFIDVRGFVPEASLETVWRDADLFTMPCRGGGFGLVYIEAMRHGLPIVASVHDAAPEVNIDGVTGFNVALDGSSALADRLTLLLTQPDLRRSMGDVGQDRWRTHFRPSAFQQRFVGLLTERGLLRS